MVGECVVKLLATIQLLLNTLNKRYINDPEEIPCFSDANNRNVLLLLSKDFLDAHAALFQYAEASRQSAPDIIYCELEHIASEFFKEQDHNATSREMLPFEHVAQDENPPQALSPSFTSDILSPSLVSDASLPCCASTSKFSDIDVPVLFEDNSNFDSVKDMLKLLETYEQDNRPGNIPDQRREMLLVEHLAQDDSLSPTALPSFTSEIMSGSLVEDDSLPCSASTIQAELPSPPQTVVSLTTHDINGVHQSHISTQDPSSPQTATSSNTSATIFQNLRVPQASSHTRKPQISKSPFKPKRSPRISSRADVEQGQEGAFGRSGKPSTGTSRKELKHLPANTLWKEDVYELAWEGTMLAKHQEQLVLVSKAKAYKTMSAPESLTAGWPRLLMMGNIIPQATVSRSYQGQTHDLIFEVMDDNKIHSLLHDDELCIIYSMPTQSLIIIPTENNHFTGKVYPDGGQPVHSGATSG